MNFLKFGSLFLLFGSSLAVMPIISSPADASCVMTDVSLQVAVRGSQTPSNQSNDVSMGSTDNCWGNNVTNLSTQVYVGSGHGNQGRTSQLFVGNENNSNSSISGFSTPAIQTQISVPIDVYSPAHDPDFMDSLGLPFQP